MDIGNPPAFDPNEAGTLARAAYTVLREPLSGAGFGFDQKWGWIRKDAESFVGISVRVVDPDGPPGGRSKGGVAITFGWRYGAFGDPPPSPPMAEGCIRQLSIDDFETSPGLRLTNLADLASSGELAAWERQLAMAFGKGVVKWLDPWKRPAGFRDFVSGMGLHLAAAWLSAMLGHTERVDLELRSAAALDAVPLEEGFDRRLADRDEAFAAPLGARHGLADALAAADRVGDHRTIDAFGGERAVRARDRVTEPGREHARLLRRHEIYAALCLEYVRSAAQPGI